MTATHLVRMIVYIHSGEWKTPFVTDHPAVEVDVAEDATLAEVSNLALKESGVDFEPKWLWAVAERDRQGRRMTEGVGVVIAGDGAFRWTGDGLGKRTVRELERARDEGWFDGDPHSLCIEHMLGADGFIPQWSDFHKWLIDVGGAYGGVLALKAAVKTIQTLLERYLPWWRDERGAKTPYAFLDVVLARDSWTAKELARLLVIKRVEANELLEALGYARQGKSDLFQQSDDLERGALRVAIIDDFLKRDPARKKKKKGKHL